MEATSQVTVAMEADMNDFEKILEQAEPIIQNVVRSFRGAIAGTILDPDDLRQELEICVWKVYCKYDPQRSRLSTFLTESLKNRAKELLRHELAQKRGGTSIIGSLNAYLDAEEEGDTILDYTVDECASVEADAYCHEIMEARDEILLSMDPRHAEAILMILAGIKQTDIAKKLGMTQPMISQAYTRFKRNLAKKLETMGYTGVSCRMKKRVH